MKARLFILFVVVWLMFVAALIPEGLFKEPPPGTVCLTDSLYIDRQPVRTVDYLEFLADIRNSYTPKLIDSIYKLPLYNLSPDIAFRLYDSLPMDSAFYERMLTRTWQVKSSDHKFYGIDYRLLSSKYYKYPVVNINYYQLFEYCRWRTAKIKLYYASRCKTLRERKKYPISFVYRPVQRKEWELAMSVFYQDVDCLDEDYSAMQVQKDVGSYRYDKKQAFFYESNNAAEYLDGDIVTTGFSCSEKYGIGEIGYMFYENPTDWVSFRCICQILPDTINKPGPVIAHKEKEKKPKGEKPPKEKVRKTKGIDAAKVKRPK